jgi:hypothetical protein
MCALARTLIGETNKNYFAMIAQTSPLFSGAFIYQIIETSAVIFLLDRKQ